MFEESDIVPILKQQYIHQLLLNNQEANLESCQTFTMDLFVKIINEF